MILVYNLFVQFRIHLTEIVNQFRMQFLHQQFPGLAIRRKVTIISLMRGTKGSSYFFTASLCISLSRFDQNPYRRFDQNPYRRFSHIARNKFCMKQIRSFKTLSRKSSLRFSDYNIQGDADIVGFVSYWYCFFLVSLVCYQIFSIRSGTDPTIFFVFLKIVIKS